MIKTKEKLTEIYAKHTGQSMEVLTKAMDRDNFMDAEAAKAFGLVDHVVESRKISGKAS